MQISAGQFYFKLKEEMKKKVANAIMPGSVKCYKCCKEFYKFEGIVDLNYCNEN